MQREAGRGTRDDSIGVAAADVSTGRSAAHRRDDRTSSIRCSRGSRRARSWSPTASRFPLPASRAEALVTEREAWEFDEPLAREDLARQYGVLSLDGLGIDSSDALAVSARPARCSATCASCSRAGLPQLARPIIERPGGVMPLDEMTRRNLELVESLRGGGVEGTLLSVLDRTGTPMGARLLRQWILAPLTARTAIDARLDAVATLERRRRRARSDARRDRRRARRRATRGESGVGPQHTARASRTRRFARRAAGRCDRAAAASPSDAGRLREILAQWDDAAELASQICATLVERPPIAIGDEPTIAPGVDADLDDAARVFATAGATRSREFRPTSETRTGIASLKVGFNKVFGYYIEVTNSNLHLVPPDYQRRQTITSGERFVTPALKEYEERVSDARPSGSSRASASCSRRLRAAAGREIARLQRIARAIAELDVLSTLADVAAREGYVRPTMSDEFDLDIVAGRHPVVERMMPRDKFIPNDLRLPRDARMIILTGPNMAGKSTVLRQIGLIVLMAQIGSFVPASAARIGVVDRIFTRVGASDNLVRGQSTFMVEMTETSAILHTATSRSLVLLDEIGRGTATYDGVSIAWAVTEHLHERVGCKTVFATHYHELTQLSDELPALRNYNVAVREAGDQILFLHRLQPGGADRSYGIEVGRLAGLPQSVIARARTILALLEGEHLAGGAGPQDGARTGGAMDQLALFGAAPNPVVEELAATGHEHDDATRGADGARASRRGGEAPAVTRVVASRGSASLRLSSRLGDCAASEFS